MARITTISLALMLAATAALAHKGVQNQAVKARMDNMSELAAATKTIGEMAKGITEFDKTAAARALADLSTHGQKIPDLFEAREDDPKSEARDSIWKKWDDFTARSAAMIQTVDAITLDGPDDLRPALAKIGETCRACHEAYRE